MKQRNLFGQPVAEGATGDVGGKGKKKPAGKEKTKADPKRKSKSPLPDTVGEGAAKGKRSEGLATESQDTQMEDDSQATTDLDSQVQEVETQLEETQLDGSSPPVDTEAETQPATQSQTEEGESQLETRVDEDDGEPVSHPAREYLTRTLTVGGGLILGHRMAGYTATRDDSGAIVLRGALERHSRPDFYRLDLYRYVRNIITSPHATGMGAWDSEVTGIIWAVVGHRKTARVGPWSQPSWSRFTGFYDKSNVASGYVNTPEGLWSTKVVWFVALFGIHVVFPLPGQEH